MDVVAGLQHHYFRLFRLYQEKQGGNENTRSYHEAIHVRQWEECMIASMVLLTLVMSVTGFNVWMYLLCPLWFYLQYGLEYAVSRVYHSFKGIHGADGNKISYGNSAFEMGQNPMKR